MDNTDLRKDQGVGDQDNVSSIPLQKTRRNMCRLSCKDMQDGQEDIDTDGFTLSVLSDCIEHVVCHGMGL